MLESIWAYRAFILGSVKREFQLKYRNSMLGVAWTVINPLAMILIYTVIFSQIMRAKLPGVESSFSYSIYLCAGLLTWGLFSEITSRSMSMFIDNANLLKKLSFPRLCLPVVVVLTALLNFSIVFGLFSLFLIFSGNFPGWSFVAMLPLVVIQVGFSVALGIYLGVLNVFFRDVGQFFGIFIQFWFWLTPIVYVIDIVPKAYQPWLALNPMTSLIGAYQRVLVMGARPQWHTLWPVTLFTLFLCIFSLRLFRKHSGDLVDEL